MVLYEVVMNISICGFYSVCAVLCCAVLCCAVLCCAVLCCITVHTINVCMYTRAAAIMYARATARLFDLPPNQMDIEVDVVQGLYRCSDETGREIQQLQQQYDQTDPWSDELAELHSTFSDYAVRTEAAESKVLADNSAVNAADLQAVNQSYIRALKQFQKVCCKDSERVSSMPYLRVTCMAHLACSFIENMDYTARCTTLMSLETKLKLLSQTTFWQILYLGPSMDVHKNQCSSCWSCDMCTKLLTEGKGHRSYLPASRLQLYSCYTICFSLHV